MTVPPPPVVPGELIEKAAKALRQADEVIQTATAMAEHVLAAVYGDIVEAARRDALTAAVEAIEAQGASWCGDYEPPESEHRAEYERRMREYPEFDQHIPDAYSPYCDGCAAADSANRDRAATVRIVTDLRDGTAPRHGLNATHADPTPVPRTPGTPERSRGHSGPSESYTVADIRAAWAKHANPDDWGVRCFYEDGLIAALRGEYDEEPTHD